ncbi:MAG: restriction endonuclease [Bacteroidales bacterium]|nr:restriction endonuclease [Bacteroidales bacterium]
MSHNIKVMKVSGNMEKFSRTKLMHSLQRSGANPTAVDAVVREVETKLFDGISSKMIYDLSFSLLRKRELGLAARYKLKKAMMELGPTGYPFEYFVGEIFRRQGFNVEVGQILQGHCVTHEVDVIATKGMEQHFIECKYYLRTGKNANVQVPLYIRSRVDDLIKERRLQPEYSGYTFHGGVVTNTRFTSDAISFGECTGLHLLGWDYPEGNGLKEIIDREHIFPITVLTRLSLNEKKMLMDNGFVICSQLLDHPDALDTIGMNIDKQQKVLREVRFLCPKSLL